MGGTEEARRDTVPHLSVWGFSNLKFCPQWSLDPRAFLASQVAQHRMNCSGPEDLGEGRVQFTVCPLALHVLKSAPLGMVGVRNGEAEGRNSRTKGLVGNKCSGSVGTPQRLSPLTGAPQNVSFLFL